MKEKLLLVKEIYFSKRKLANRNEEKRIYNVLLCAYINACISKKTDKFVLFFDGKYIQNRKERVLDWFHYCINKCYEMFYKTFKPNDDKILMKYNSTKPIHIKVSNFPDEWILEQILTRHGFKIVDEYLYSTATEYEIAKLEMSAQKSTTNGAKK